MATHNYNNRTAGTNSTPIRATALSVTKDSHTETARVLPGPSASRNRQTEALCRYWQPFVYAVGQAVWPSGSAASMALMILGQESSPLSFVTQA